MSQRAETSLEDPQGRLERALIEEYCTNAAAASPR